MSEDDPIHLTCFLCGATFPFGPRRFDGRKLHSYGGIMVCNACYDRHPEGWSPHHEERLINHMKALGLPIPTRNANGLLPRV